jgi:hypothetical protein
LVFFNFFLFNFKIPVICLVNYIAVIIFLKRTH